MENMTLNNDDKLVISGKDELYKGIFRCSERNIRSRPLRNLQQYLNLKCKYWS